MSDICVIYMYFSRFHFRDIISLESGKAWNAGKFGMRENPDDVFVNK